MAVKRLKKNLELHGELVSRMDAPRKQQKGTVTCYVTEKTLEEFEIPFKLPKKLLFIKPKVLFSELIYVPCWWVAMEYHVIQLRKGRTTDGNVQFVVDDVVGSAVIDSSIHFHPIKKKIDGSLLSAHSLTREQAERKAKIEARWKVVFAMYRSPPYLDNLKSSFFFRPYYKVRLCYGYGKEKERMIAADGYANYSSLT